MSAPTPMTMQSTPTYKLAATRLALYAVQALGGAILATLTGVKWSTLDGQSKFLIVVGIAVSFSSTVQAFIDKTMARLGDGKAALESGGTQTPFSSASQPPKQPNQ